MGTTFAPKTFPSATPFGASPPSPVTTQVQDTPTVTGDGTPAYGAYSQQKIQPPAADPSQSPVQDFGGGGDIEQYRQQLLNRRANGPMPFLG